MPELTSFNTLINGFIEQVRANNPPDEGDYLQDGLLYCSKCKTPKESIIELKGNNGVKTGYKVPILCKCQEKWYFERAQKKKDAENKAFIESLRSKSLMDAKFLTQNIENFHETQANSKILHLIKRYIMGFNTMLKNNQGLLFFGNVGTGKTFAAAAIANALLAQGFSVVMTSFVKLLGDFSADENTIKRLNKAQLLIIDDLGAERSTDYALERVYNIIDARYRKAMPMILTTNLPLWDIKKVADIRYARIYDRILEVCYPVEFTGVSCRKEEAKRRYYAMQDFLKS